MATQRQHNFKMSYDGPEKQEEKSGYKLTAQQAQQSKHNIPKGFSNLHSVQIGKNNRQEHYKSLTSSQQDGHNVNNQGLQVQKADLNAIKQEIQRQKKDLRSSHFELGNNTAPAMAPALLNYPAPPQDALNFNAETQKKAQEKIQRSNFSLKDGTAGTVSRTTQQAQNNSLQSMIQNGNFQIAKRV